MHTFIACVAASIGFAVGVLVGNLANVLFFGGWYSLGAQGTLNLESVVHNLGNISLMFFAGLIGAGTLFQMTREALDRRVER